MKRTTSLAAAVTAAAVIVTPVAGTATAATSVPASIAAPQAITLPSAESFAPDPLKVLALPFSNFDVARQSIFVVTGQRTNPAGEYLDKSGAVIVQKSGESVADFKARQLKESAIEENIFQAISDAVNKVALKGDFAKAATLIQGYLTQVAQRVMALPTALIDLNVGAFFPKPTVNALSKASVASAPAAASPFAFPSVGALLNVAAIPLKNFDQARLATFVTTGYEKDKAGNLVDKDGKPLLTKEKYLEAHQGENEEDYKAYVAENRVAITTNIYTALNAAVNVALSGNFSGAAAAAQGYLTEFAGNIVSLPREIIDHDLKTIGAVVPGIPQLPEVKSSETKTPPAAAPAGASAPGAVTKKVELESDQVPATTSEAKPTGAPATGSPKSEGGNAPSVKINIFGLDLSPKSPEKSATPEAPTTDAPDKDAVVEEGANSAE